MGNPTAKAPSKAAAALKQRLMNQSDLAMRLGVSPQAVSAWLAGRARPETDRMAEIEAIFGIPMRDWAENESGDESGTDINEFPAKSA